jgi:hypothetical protein
MHIRVNAKDSEINFLSILGLPTTDGIALSHGRIDLVPKNNNSLIEKILLWAGR